MPVRVDFYLLNKEEPDVKWLLACRILEKAYHRGHQVFVVCQNRQDAETLDELLWTFKDDSFIPHNLEGEGPQPPPPVHITYSTEPKGFSDILLNMCDEIPTFYTRFKRVIEIVANNEDSKEKGREKYKEYRRNACELQTNNID